MESGNIPASADALTAILLLALYLPLGGYACRRLLPGLTRTARLLALACLLAQGALILLSFVERPAFSFDWWLWHLDREYNIPATLASMQLALAACASLLAARLGSPRPRWQRLFFLGLALLFTFLAADEFLLLHEDDEAGFALIYAALGSGAALLTLAMARKAGPERRWQLCFLAGMAVAAFGAFGIDKALFACERWLFFVLDKCLYLVPLEEACEFLGVWLALVALLGMARRPADEGARTMSGRGSRLLLAWSFIWLLLLFLWAQLPRIELGLVAEATETQFGNGARLHGYRVEPRPDEVVVHLYPSARQADYPWLGYSVVLVDQVSGAELARRDRYSRGQLLWYLGAAWRSLYRETVQVALPSDMPRNRAYWIVLTQWREREGVFGTQAVVETDLPRLTEMQLVLGETLRPAPARAAAAEPLARFDAGLALMSADIPASATAGHSLPIAFHWRADAKGGEDLIQFLHLGHSESGAWQTHDQEPLGPRLPTRLWYAGLDDSETWRVKLPKDLAAGEYSLFTGLYRHDDKERLPAYDAAGAAWLDNRVALGRIVIR